MRSLLRSVDITSSRLTQLSLAVLSLTLLNGCMMFLKPPAASEFSWTRISQHALYRATIKPAGDSIPEGKLQTWTLHLETVDSAAVDSASVGVWGGMPQHGHGLPTKPQVTRPLGGGDHLVEGVKFNMGGWWVVKFRVAAAAGTDTVVFNLKL